jgi:hypothetical protein
VEKETFYRDDEPAILTALFRWGVIAPVADRDDFAPGEVMKIVREIAQTTHYLPGSGPVRVGERTVFAWLKAYRHGGIEALRPRHRKDRGTPRAVSGELIERAIQLRKEGPERWTSTLIDILRLEGAFEGKTIPHRATLDRHLALQGASRRQMGILAAKRTIKMRFEQFGDLWVGDYHHGPLVLGPDGRPRTSKLGAFIDHCTRYPVADRYYLSEELPTLRDTMLRAFLRWGLAKIIYVDRGSVYRSDQLAYSLRMVESNLVHSRAYYSQGRGVIERWWQEADQFEAEVRRLDTLLTIHEINNRWEAYRELRYCQEVHSELGRTPAEAIAEVIPKPIDPAVARRLFLVRENRKVDRKDACVSVLGQRFVCDSALRGRKVQVYFDPADLSSVNIFVEGKRVQNALPQQPGEPPEPHTQPPEKVPQSVDYLGMLRSDFDQKLLEQARPLAYTQLDLDPAFSRDHFVAIVCQLAGLRQLPSICHEIETFWDMYGPLPEALVRIGVEHAIRLSARGRHPQVYLHAVRTLVLAHWRSSGKDPT